MPHKTWLLATWAVTLLLAWGPVPAAADVTAGIAAYNQRNFTGALIEFQEAAKHDDVRALNYLAIMYAEGIGTPRNDAMAAALFSKAALLGFPEAMANMGRMYAEGRGVPQDNKAAIASYSSAARNGFKPAITRMAMIYEKGELGVAPDAAKAREWHARLSAPSAQPVPEPKAAVRAPGAVAQPAQPVETPDMVASVRAARGQLQVPQTQPADAAPPQVITPEHGTIATVIQQPSPIQKQKTQPVDATPGLASVPAQNVIESIAVTLQSGEILIRVRTKTPLAMLPAEFMVKTPPRIVFDFPNTATGLGRHHEIGEGDLQSVDVISSESRTRMVLILRNGMQHNARMDGDELLIRLTTITAPATSSNTGSPPRRPGH